MAAPKNLRILPRGRINGLSTRVTRSGSGRLLIRRPSAPILFLGACTYASAYLSLGLSGLSTVGGLLAWLKERGPRFAEALQDPTVVRVAVNHDVARGDTPLKAGDEVALFPPVTGG